MLNRITQFLRPKPKTAIVYDLDVDQIVRLMLPVFQPPEGLHVGAVVLDDHQVYEIYRTGGGYVAVCRHDGEVRSCFDAAPIIDAFVKGKTR